MRAGDVGDNRAVARTDRPLIACAATEGIPYISSRFPTAGTASVEASLTHLKGLFFGAQQYLAILDGSRCDERISQSECGRQRVLLNGDRRAVSDVLSQKQRGKSEVLQVRRDVVGAASTDSSGTLCARYAWVT